MSDSREAHWERRFGSTDDYLFGTAPNAFLAAEAHRIAPGARVLAVADGEGRNGVFLAGRGAIVHAVDGARAAIAKSKRLAANRGVSLTWEQADLTKWHWPVSAYDVVVAIFVQFVTPTEQPAFFMHLQAALKPGGLLLLEGYRPEQIANHTGGPSDPAHLYTETLLRQAFAGMTIEALRSRDAMIEEGTGHAGMSALIDLIAVKPE